MTGMQRAMRGRPRTRPSR